MLSYVTILYDELELLSEEFDELSDTEVRESIHAALNYYFVWEKPMDRLPITFGMFSQAGDKAVAAAVRRFLQVAVPAARAAKIPQGQARLDILQDPSVRTRSGRSFDEFIGQSDTPSPPSIDRHMFEVAEYEDDG